MSFIDDIQGQNTQLYPIVVIELGETTGGGNALENLYPDYIFLSTNNSTIRILHESNTVVQNKTRYCKPLLLNIPSIKESVDIESRKFKISNVSLDISNIEYEGKRFTDILSESPLINVPVSIYFKSPSTTYVHSGDVPDEYSNTLCPRIYTGIIRRLTHDDTKVKIELEDLTEQKAHKDLPQAYLGDTENIPDKYKNKPIPMVYGHVDRSPLVISENYRKFIIDSKGINNQNNFTNAFNINQSSLYIYNDKYLNVVQGGAGEEEGVGEDELGVETQFFFRDSYYELNSQNENIYLSSSEGELQESILSVTDSLNDYRVTIKPNLRWGNQGGLSAEDFLVTSQSSLDGISDGLDSVNHIELTTTIEAYSPSTNKFEVMGWSLIFNYEPAYDNNAYSLIGLVINNKELNDLIAHQSSAVSSNTYGVFPIRTDSLSSSYPGVNTPHIDAAVNVESSGDTANFSGSYSDWHHIQDSLAPEYQDLNNLFNFSSVDNNTSANIQYEVSASGLESGHQAIVHKRCDIILLRDEVGSLIIEPRGCFYVINRENVNTSGGNFSVTMSLSGDLNEIKLLRLVEVINPFKYDLYADIKGRINTFGDHPLPPAQGFIENPIDIIYDLVRSELGHDAIDEADYQEARLAHNNWEFGFTVTKKINSKKLIQEIAKSTKCFPKFKNDGTFGFNTIKDSYTVTDIDNGVERGDYNAAHLIKESEVISYSFKKTKPEQIYKKVTVNYKKDYAQNSYLKNLTEDSSSFGQFFEGGDYYPNNKNELNFESDYIRHDLTANELEQFLTRQYWHDHLIINLKLPLQYINLDIGDLVKLRELLGGIKAYGIDYRLISGLGNVWGDSIPHQGYSQYAYPLFMITSITKNLDSISIECIQLHHLPIITSNDQYNAINEEWFEDTFLDQVGESVVGESVGDETVGDETVVGGSVGDETPHEGAALIDGFRTFGVNEFHYGGDSRHNLEHLDNAFAFLFYNESNIIDPEGSNPPNIFHDNTGSQVNNAVYYPNTITAGSQNIRKVVQVSGLPDASDNGLYFLAATFIDLDFVNIPFEDGVSGWTSMWLNHWCFFQKITMTKNVWNSNTYSIDSTSGVSSYSTPEEGVWFTDPVIDDTHVLNQNIFQRNTGSFDEYGDINTPNDNFQNVDMPQLVTPDDPIMVGGDGEVDDFVGGIHSSEISSIGLTSLPLAPMVGNLGDSNVDGFLNILDIVGTVNYILGTGDLSEGGIISADSNQDGYLNILDIVTTANDILGTDY